MLQDQSTIAKQHLRQIADMLLLNGTLTICPGLVHGKTGIAVFFFHYARYTDKELFIDYAWDLLGEIQNQIHVNSPADYEKGISGIGLGIDYLIRNEFVDPEDDIFEDLDQRMYRAVMYDPWQDFTLYHGLTGYGRYWIARLRRQPLSVQARECLMRIAGLIEENLQNISLEEETDVYCFLHDLHDVPAFDIPVGLSEQYRKRDLSLTDSNRYFPRLEGSAIGNIIRMQLCSWYFNDALQGDIDMALKQISDLNMENSLVGTGVLSGYAGEGLLLLTAFNQTNQSWMNLL